MEKIPAMWTLITASTPLISRGTSSKPTTVCPRCAVLQRVRHEQPKAQLLKQEAEQRVELNWHQKDDGHSGRRRLRCLPRLHNKANGHIDWAEREKELRELRDQYRKNDRLVPALAARTASAPSSAEIQVRYAPADQTWAPHIYTPSGAGTICRRGSMQALTTTCAPPTQAVLPSADLSGYGKPVPSVPAVHPRAAA